MNRSVVVTGASRGIGAAIARELASRGWSVIAAARTEPDTRALVRELENSFGQRACAVRMDVADPESVSTGIQRAEEFAANAGPIEALVNNAGIAISAPLLGRSSTGIDLYEQHMRVNFHGARLVAEGLLPGMIERGSGGIVNVASSAGLHGYSYVSAYCASKHALIGWTRSAAMELESKQVRVQAVCPHYVDSPMLAESVQRLVEKTGKSQAEAREFFAQQNPGGRLVTPEEVARAVAYLLGRKITGTILELDGSRIEQTASERENWPLSP
ncbi:MAG: NAD(P)-dependent dehydrogenase (short-subunit alcohol dehydrogenase family) [Planctomycetota bacterium]|jgi:NAD(P)-dependent dehydrogenase (short-subunit alcohol dehydrogenase family)